MFCFQRGVIKNLGPTCPNPSQDGRLREGVGAQYGSWLRASPHVRSSLSYTKKKDESEGLGDLCQNKKEPNKYEDYGMGSGAKGTNAETSNHVDKESSDTYQS